MRSVCRLLFLFLLAVVLVTGCVPVDASANIPDAAPTAIADSEAKTTSLPNPTGVPTQTTALKTATSTALGWQADGVVSLGEYAHKATSGPLTVYWRNDDTNLYLALEARAVGWLSIGFDPDRTHIGADIIIGAVSNGMVTILDSYGTSERGTFHTPDVNLGGDDSITASGGSQQGGVTILEFQIPLNSGDKYDKVLEAGTTVPVILAVGTTSNLTSMHSFASFGEIQLD
ncbi:MAG: DOMON domain-containing protein [Anaerolineae bacterium]